MTSHRGAGVRTYRPPDDDAAIRAVMEASLAQDRIPGFTATDIDRALTRIPADAGGTVVAIDAGLIVGYCTPRHNDLTVAPLSRRRGHGRRLVQAALETLRERRDPMVRLYVPRHLEASRAFANALGFTYHSSLWVFELPPDRPVPEPSFGPDVVVRTWAPDEDIDAWVEFNNATFEGHSTPLNVTAELVRTVHDQPSFDPAGILLAAPASEPDRPVGFARVEILPGADGRPTGYVNLIGVLPAWRGRGLGRELLRWGVGYLRGRGAGLVELTVEAANERATQLYRRHGFEPTIEWPQYVLPT